MTHHVHFLVGVDAAGAVSRMMQLRHLQQEHALASPIFQSMVEKALRRPVLVRPPGLPRGI